MPVASMAAVVQPASLSHAAMASRSAVQAPKVRVSTCVRSAVATATTWKSLPMSMPAASGRRVSSAESRATDGGRVFFGMAASRKRSASHAAAIR